MKSEFIYLAISFLVVVLVWISFSFGLFSGLEKFFEDLLFSPKQISKDLVIIAIDNESISRIGQWPWPREIFAKAFLKINENAPLVLGFDVMFSEPSRFGIKDDTALAEALDKISYPIIFPVEANEVILAKNKPAQTVNFLKPLPIFQKPGKVILGHINLILDGDGIVRRFPLVISKKEDENEKFQLFAFEAIKKRSGERITFKTDLQNINRIVYAGAAGSIRRIPFWRILQGEAIETIKDKVVFIGATASDLHDIESTPLNRGKKMPGVEIQANIANMLLFDYRLLPLPVFFSFLWIFLAAFLPAVIFIFWPKSFKPLFIILALPVIYLVVVIILFQNGVVANILHINFAWVFSTISLFGYRYFIGEKEKREIKSIFSKYVSPEILREILADPSKVTLGGEEREITVLFVDIRDFTSLAEKTESQELVRILNQYFSAMTEEILKNRGMLDKYIGDAIMAFWGAPIDDPNQAEAGFKASLAMIRKLKLLNEQMGRIEDIKIGIGLYTGKAVVGNIGSESRFDYTAIGDTVNIASRLENLTKKYNVSIIIGESTKNKIKEDYQFEFLGQVAVKGKKKLINIYTVR